MSRTTNVDRALRIRRYMYSYNYPCNYLLIDALVRGIAWEDALRVSERNALYAG